ncbi:alpha-mannosidase [Companilactobacillus allii]|uniref:Alpha-mannosidase n=1 Tax=Companilactobacillus allii TaxID=1847728 RepID=A0A1P8Q0L1_9LACO|nr:glycoside hydrolase family 38 C-terminal domain-containing protein [Companilactobacillus allii]APX71413.1 alpha-mannosidase [Companilactobacillus allii]USQ68493.1 alpha-mannosidase [Companilactobacillus allii]
MKNIHVIQHTHWDFEWYFTRNEAIIQFVYHMDEVFKALEDQIVDYYLLDGQMSILDDYLDAYPEKKEELSKWVRNGRLFIGPWYTQTDEMIVTGESIVRNLSLGMEMADKLGGSQRIGYLPDSFGQAADMPKIYNGMGITNALFWRGLSEDKTRNREFVWNSEDGSNVTTLNIKDGYFVGVGLIDDDNVDSTMKTVISGTTIDDIALPVGGDQRYVDYNLKDRIKFYNDALKDKDIQLFESNYPALFIKMNMKRNALDNVSGEFINSSVSKIHRSIYSSRYDQKYLNDKVERRMIYQLEPLMVMADRVGIEYKKSLLNKIWKLIVRNHAHDSAGGCNSDKTNKIILDRLQEADQLSYSAVDYLTRKISESQKNKEPNDLTFFNTLPFNTEKIVKFNVSLKNKDFDLYDNDKKILVDILDIEKKYNGQIKRDESQYKETDYYYIFHCQAKITLPSLQWKKLKLVPKMGNAEVIGHTESNSISNGDLRIKYSNGDLTLLDLKNNKEFEKLLIFEDGGDEGDTYDYSPAYKDNIIYLNYNDATVKVQNGKVGQKMILTGQWNLPKDLDERANKTNSGIVNYELELTLDRDNQIQFHLDIENDVKDHRMRAIFNSDIESQYSYADTGFGYIRRSVVDPHLRDWKELGWKEEPTAIFPMLHYVNVHNDDSSWTVMAKGNKEYQIIGKNYNQIALTLFRSVGFLGRPDLIRRPGVASGNQFTYIPTPDSQLIEKLHFKFALQLNDRFMPAEMMKNFQIYAISQPFYQEQNLNLFTNTLKYFVMQPLDKQIESNPFLEIKNKNLIFSSLTESQDESGWLLRVYNPSKHSCGGNDLVLLNDFYFISETDFVGRLKRSMGKMKNISCGDFKPGEVKTIKINK